MIRVSRRRLLLAVLAFVIFGVGYLAWTLGGLPPARFILRYGLSPYCEPTGQKRTIEGIEFIEIGPGIFRMGSNHRSGGGWFEHAADRLGLPSGRASRYSNEQPVHWVEFRRSFWLASTEVTNELYERFDTDHERSRHSVADRAPALNVSWEDARRFCAWLGQESGRPVRLPSEAEWECACRAGGTTEYSHGDDHQDLGRYAWFIGNSGGSAHEVAVRVSNLWGFHDMHGNADEWCEDAYRGSLAGSPTDGSARECEDWDWGDERARVIRGGAFASYPVDCRSAARNFGSATGRGFGGIRLALTSPDPAASAPKPGPGSRR